MTRLLRYPASAAVLVALALGACTEDGTGSHPTPPPATYTLSIASQWSGGAVGLTSSTANAGRAPRLVLVGTDSVTATAVSDTTFTFTLPPGPAGSLLVRVPQSGGAVIDTVGAIDRVGYRDTRDLSEMNWGHRIWRPNGRIAILGYLQTPFGRLASIDVATGSVTSYPGLTYAGDYSYPVSPANVTDAFVLTDTVSGTRGVWRLTPAPVRVDSVPVATIARQVAQLSDSVWLATGSNSVDLLPSPPAAGLVEVIEPQQAVLAPDASFAVVEATERTAGTGVPVFDAHSGLIRFHIPVHQVISAAIAADSRAVYVVKGARPAPGDSLLQIDVTDGHVAHAAAIPDSLDAFELSKDIVQNRLYVAAEVNNNITVLVYDASTLSLLGRLPSGQQCLWNETYCANSNIAVDSAAHLLYLTQPGNPATVRTFDLLP